MEPKRSVEKMKKKKSPHEMLVKTEKVKGKNCDRLK